MKEALADRNAAADVLKKRLRDVIAELTIKLPPMDNRWLTFGLNRPGQKVRPPAPLEVQAILIGPTAISVKWAKAARANYYRVWIRIVGSESDFAPAGSPADLDFTIEGLEPNSQYEIAVSAMNNGGESAKSQLVIVSTP